MRTIVRITLRSNGNNNIYRFNSESEAHDFYLKRIREVDQDTWKIEILTEQMLKSK
jgi:hypothetical protein